MNAQLNRWPSFVAGTVCRLARTTVGAIERVGPVDRQRRAESQKLRCPKKTVSAKRLTKRLYAAIDQELQQLEAGVESDQSPAVTSVADIERRTRTLTNMIRGFEKVLELDTDKRKRKRGGAKRRTGQGFERAQADISADDAERMRQDIAERLERLHAQWADTSRSAGSQS